LSRLNDDDDDLVVVAVNADTVHDDDGRPTLFWAANDNKSANPIAVAENEATLAIVNTYVDIDCCSIVELNVNGLLVLLLLPSIGRMFHRHLPPFCESAVVVRHFPPNIAFICILHIL
jgi:hypothetical protein